MENIEYITAEAIEDIQIKVAIRAQAHKEVIGYLENALTLFTEEYEVPQEYKDYNIDVIKEIIALVKENTYKTKPLSQKTKDTVEDIFKRLGEKLAAEDPDPEGTAQYYKELEEIRASIPPYDLNKSPYKDMSTADLIKLAQGKELFTTTLISKDENNNS